MTAATCYTHFESPLGQLVIQGDGQFITGLYMTEHKGWHGPTGTRLEHDPLFAMAGTQLSEYFAGKRREFELPVRLAGTPFQQHVWRELVRIPFGETISYGELARRVGNPAASRAVGSANGRNPVSIIVPCHRVIGANQKLTGYGGGIERKQWLLNWERQALVSDTSLASGHASLQLAGVEDLAVAPVA